MPSSRQSRRCCLPNVNATRIRCNRQSVAAAPQGTLQAVVPQGAMYGERNIGRNAAAVARSIHVVTGVRCNAHRDTSRIAMDFDGAGGTLLHLDPSTVGGGINSAGDPGGMD